MFGLTKREQRWKAEQKTAETLVPLVTAIVQAQSEASELERLRAENKAAWDSAEYNARRAEKAEARAAELESFVADVADNYDCDEDAHRYGTQCRKCKAAALSGRGG